MMRQLTEIELQEIRRSTMRKEIFSAEILMEIYDHYISHLQEFSESQFHEQLFELDQKFTYGYCHALQAKFNKEAKEDIYQTQWMVIRKYFCTSRWLYLAGIMALAFYVATQARTEEELRVLLLSPMILLLIANIGFGYQNFKKLRPVKKAFKDNGIPIRSSLALPISERMYFPILMVQFFVYIPKLIFTNLDISPYLAAGAGIFTVLLTLYVISMIEVWKIKSKTALV
ncbi:hypothetical protein [Belliella aquatica]|uniref:DUF3278 domain-containing protein n=1 Tax=Belliella aquatica TaxID=1323734 RepID=A0ABQ1M481_9BACT|nr:hypothetical protein [Belliella aquatica]MCH7404881.1 hypothetical protein [Belliella aquatica]GGC33375.1 hypothetical protein GCM10010993_10360 [Belliella aquatica]